MSKKDEALKKCLRVLNPIANENVYETQWIDSAIHAAYEALEEKEWQGLSDEEVNNIFVEYADLGGDVSLDKCLIAYRKAEQKLKENNT
tara:strand:- start:820 stop:1086 length:267 start_codon:yes stop_codon:yes gene_type:complete